MPLRLRPETVSNIQGFGGTILGSSRGPHDIKEMVDALEELDVDILFAIGGDGTMKGLAALVAEIQRRGLKKASLEYRKPSITISCTSTRVLVLKRRSRKP
jgi:6-phosphofructokinase 1